MKTSEPIRNKKHVRELTAYYLKRGEIRNYVLIVIGVYTALRISDLLRLRWDDVYDFENGRVRESIRVTEKKTGKPKTIALNRRIKTALLLYVPAARRGAFIVKNKRTDKALSRIQAYRLIRAAGEALKWAYRVTCHSLRKTFGYHAWKNGVSPVVIMDIYNHSSLAVTKRYLGVTQDDRDEVYMTLDFSQSNTQPQKTQALFCGKESLREKY